MLEPVDKTTFLADPGVFKHDVTCDPEDLLFKRHGLKQ
jgi:hypothetical protein